MQLDKHLPFEGTTVLVVAAAVAVGVAVGTTVNVGQSDGAQKDVLQWEGHITVEKNGDIVWQGHNVLTDQGQNWIRDQISESTDLVVDDTSTNVTWISLGNGSAPSAATTQLDEEIAVGSLSRADGTQTTFPGAGLFQIQNTFTATADIGVVNTTGLNWNSSGPSIVSGGAFNTEANILTDDQLTVTHNITIS